jgi:hypothetical protein
MLAIGTQIRYRITAILAAHWEEFFLTYRGWIRPVVIETVRQMRACRTPALGCHLYQCPECGRYAVVAHSSKSRFCPTCGKHATDRWADGVLNDLLEVPYHHLVFSPPGQLRPIILLNREVGLGLLARAAAACLNQWAREQHGMRMGFVSVLHTFGADLKWHPHVHMLVTEGGLSLDGERWVEPYNTGWLMAHAGVKKMWRYHVVKALRKAHRNQELRFPAGAAFLREFPYFNALLRKLYEFTWYAHIGACLLDPTASLRYIGRSRSGPCSPSTASRTMTVTRCASRFAITRTVAGHPSRRSRCSPFWVACCATSRTRTSRWCATAGSLHLAGRSATCRRRDAPSANPSPHRRP